MLRFKGKVTKIAYKILGKPQNFQDDKNKKDKKVERRINYDENWRLK